MKDRSDLKLGRASEQQPRLGRLLRATMARQARGMTIAPSADRIEGGGRRATKIGLIVVLLVILPLLRGPQWSNIAVGAGAIACAAVATDLLWGYGGLLFLGEPAFMTIGGYTYAVLAVRGVPPVGALLAVILVCAMAGAGVGFLTLRLRPFYLAVTTLVLVLFVQALIDIVPGLTGGAAGLNGIPGLGVGTGTMTSGEQYYVVVWGIAVGCIWMLRRIMDTTLGLKWRGTAANTRAAEGFGINVTRERMKMLIIASIVGGLAGSIYIAYTTTIIPNVFGTTAIVTILVVNVLGGLGTGYGAVVGTVVLYLAIPVLGASGEAADLTYGLAVFILLLILPDGLWTTGSKMWGWAQQHHDWGRVRLREKEYGLSAGYGGRATTGVSDSVLNVRGLRKTYGSVVALDGVDLEMKRGSIHGLIGSNGAGKSTLIGAIMGSTVSVAEAILLNGTDIAGTAGYERARMGLIRTFQRPEVLPALSLRSNVMLGVAERRARGLAGSIFSRTAIGEYGSLRTDAAHVLWNMGIEEVDVTAAIVSFGKLRMIELARAAMAKPLVLCVDEPTSGLDAADRARAASALLALAAGGVGVLLVEHDVSLIKEITTSVTVLEAGKVVAVGDPLAVFADPMVQMFYSNVLVHEDMAGPALFCENSSQPVPDDPQ